MSDKSEPTTCLPVTSCAADTPVQVTPSLENGTDSTIHDRDCGQNTRASLANLHRSACGSSSWKTSQRCVFGGWVEYSETWPRAGMMRSGTAYRLPPSAPLTGGIACSSSPGWPTPTANSSISITMDAAAREAARLHPQGRYTLATKVWEVEQKRWPTPTARDYKDGSAKSCANVPSNGLLGREIHARENHQTTGSLNADWVGLLMGFPLGWTDLGTDLGSEE